MKKLSLIILVLSFSSLIAQQEPASDPPLKPKPLHSVFANLPPFSTYDPPNAPAGMLIEIFEKIMFDLKIPYRLEHKPIARMRKLMLNGVLDIALFAKSPRNFDNYLSSKEPVVKLTLGAFWLSDDDWISIEAIQSKRVIKNYAFLFTSFFHAVKIPANKFNFVNSTSTISGLRMLQAGRGDYLLAYVEFVNAKNASLSLKLKSHPLQQVNVHFFLKRDIKDAEKILKKIDASITRNKKEGTIQKIVEKYSNETY